MKKYETIKINKNSDEPLYLQIANSIKCLIENGAFSQEDKLPAIRSLAKLLQVNNITVVNAYKVLENEGLVLTKTGSGTYVKGKDNSVQRNVDSKNKRIIESEYISVDKNQINFSTSTPSSKYFPVKDFKEMIDEVLDRDGGYAFAYQELKGFLPLRESLKYFLENKKIDTDIDDIHVISGAQQGLDIISKALVNYNDLIVVESPTYRGALAAFKMRGARIIEVPIKDDGIDIEELEEVLKTSAPKFIYVMTSFQNPTGVSYSDDKKIQLLYLAEKYNTFILEDDYLSELNFYDESSIPIKSIDKNNRVIYIKSFSKIFMPGIRLGVMITPYCISEAVESAKYNTDISTSGLMQRAFDLYLRKNKWENHINKMKLKYKEKYDCLLKVLDEGPVVFNYNKPKGGIHIWAESDIDSSILLSTARDFGVLIAPGSMFYLDERKSNFFRISIADVEVEDIYKGINKLKNAYDSQKNFRISKMLPLL